MSKTVFMIAGEASGDLLGGELMGAMKTQQPDLAFAGVGGDKMEEAGLISMLPMQELCVMGVFEVIEHLPRLMKLIKSMAGEIEKAAPDMVVMIDIPDFNFRVAKLLRKRGIYKGKIVHYVAPTVWAWRAGRAKKVAQFLDGIMCLFPFEPKYFEEHGLKAAYVGHPLTQRGLDQVDGALFRRVQGIAEDVKVLTVMFGSRQSEIEKHGAAFVEAIEYIAEQEPSLQLVVPTLPHVEYDVRAVLNDISIPVHVTIDQEEKWNAIAASDAAMAVSGTAALELAYAGVPHVVGYKTSFPTWCVMKMLVKAKFAHLANILLDQDKAIVPEFLQFNFTAGKLAAGVLKLLKDPSAAEEQRLAFDQLRQQLATEKPPSEMAASFVLDILK